MQSSSQIIEGMKEATGIDLAALISGFAGGAAAGKLAAPAAPETATPAE